MTNKKHKLESSETPREAPLQNQFDSFLFDLYLRPQHKKHLHGVFLQWFIGFTEGHGSFIVRKQRTRLAFEIFQKDPKLLYKIRSTLGFGVVSPSECKYSVNEKKGLQRIASLFAGNLVLPKRRSEFQQWFDSGKTLDLWPKTSDFVTLETRLLRENPPRLDTAWFSGFLEAEGCFSACVSLPSNGSKLPSLKQKVTVTQQDLAGEKEILEEFGRLLESSAPISLVKKPNTYRLEMSSLETHEIVIRYLQKFPFQGNKGIDFHRWWRIFLQRKEKKHLTEKGITKLKRLCKEINQQTKKLNLEKERELKKREVDDIVH